MNNTFSFIKYVFSIGIGFVLGFLVFLIPVTIAMLILTLICGIFGIPLGSFNPWIELNSSLVRQILAGAVAISGGIFLSNLYYKKAQLAWKKTTKITLLSIMMLILISIYSRWCYDNRSSLLGGSLEISMIPDSIKGVECASCGITDYASACYFRLDPNDLNKILAGRVWVKQNKAVESITEVCGNVGDKFVPFTSYYFQTSSDAGKSNHQTDVELYLNKEGTEAYITVMEP